MESVPRAPWPGCWAGTDSHDPRDVGVTPLGGVAVDQGEQSATVGQAHVRWSWAAASHVGLVRTTNEDAARVGDLVVAVCDGMGGHVAGERASRLAVDSLVALPAVGRTAPTVRAAFEAAQAALAQSIRTQPELEGMGSTGTVVAVIATAKGPAAVIGSVGDTRAFVIDSGGFRQVTVDHTVVTELLASGRLAPGEVASHPQRHVLTRALGGLEPLDVDLRTLPLAGQVRFVVTTDGVHGRIAEPRLATLAGMGGPQAAVARIMAAALAEGAPDNLTCAVVDVEVHPPSGESQLPEERTVPRHGSNAAQDPPEKER